MTREQTQRVIYPLQVYLQRRRSIIQPPQVLKYKPIPKIPDINEEQNMQPLKFTIFQLQ